MVGRIGWFSRAMATQIEVVGINDLFDSKQLAHAERTDPGRQSTVESPITRWCQG